MRIIDFIPYFVVNIITYHKLPCIIEYGGDEWFNFLFFGEDRKWHICYSKFVDKFKTEELIEVSDRFMYFVFLKAVIVLFRMRKNIRFKVEI